MGWQQADLDGIENLSETTDDVLMYFHDQMHIFWSKLKLGMELQDWIFLKVFVKHKEIVNEMKKRKIPHIEPINNLDLVKNVSGVGEPNKIIDFEIPSPNMKEIVVLEEVCKNLSHKSVEEVNKELKIKKIKDKFCLVHLQTDESKQGKIIQSYSDEKKAILLKKAILIRQKENN